MKMSVITVCYNAGNTIERTIQSVIYQNHPDIEYIIVDGGSTDSTLQVINGYRSFIHAFISEQDNGTYDAMNKGLSLATGDVVGFLNADDFYASLAVLSDVAARMQGAALDILTGNVSYFRAGQMDRVVRIYDSGQFEPKKLANGLFPAHPALFIRREILQNVGGFKAGYRIAGDFELVARILTTQKPKLAHFPEVLVKMQTGGLSTASWRSRWHINREILRACQENGIKTNLWRLLLRYPRKLTELRWG